MFGYVVLAELAPVFAISRKGAYNVTMRRIAQSSPASTESENTDCRAIYTKWLSHLTEEDVWAHACTASLQKVPTSDDGKMSIDYMAGNRKFGGKDIESSTVTAPFVRNALWHWVQKYWPLSPLHI